MIKKYEYFYDAQVKRYLMQMVRAFSGYQYKTGDRAGVPGQLRTVPCTAAKRSRQVAAIQRNMSENSLLTVPMISVDLTSYEPNREQLQNPSHVDTITVTEREIKDGAYTGNRGASATIQRLMPRPYVLTFQVDIWTSNMDQKLQLLEQINYITFPSFDIQNSDNALDWTSLTTVSFESQNWTSVTVPIGTENEIDVATLVYKMPMWITPPARIDRQRLIQQVNTNINEGERDDRGVIIETNHLARIVTTPGNHSLKVERGVITLLGDRAQVTDTAGDDYVWDDLFDTYGFVLRPGETTINLKTSLDEDAPSVVGTLSRGDQDNQLSWQPDLQTLPVNTLTAITGIIDPRQTFPGEGVMPPAAENQRYLILEDMAGPSLAWGAITARRGSIVEFVNGSWKVSFDATDHRSSEYVVNGKTGRQLRWSVDEQEWMVAIDGIYPPGMWSFGGL